jgi:flagellar protein FlgJ
VNSDSSTHAGLATSGIYTDFSGLAQLRAQASEKSPEANKAVAKQFEALFLQMMLKSMREAGQSIDSGDSDQTRFYQDMFDKQIALDLASGQGIGLASIVERQLGGVSAATQGPDGAQAASASTLQATAAAVQDWRPADADTFIRDLWPHARRVSQSLGVAPEVLVAQAALETGWGRNMIRQPDGRSSLNLFNIKADSKWDGDRVIVPTLEYRDGIAQREQAAFRTYSSLSASMDDYMSLLQASPRYQQALDNAADAGAYLRELQDAGYATDPAYASKIVSILDREDFTRTVDQMRTIDGTEDQQAG